MTEKALTITDIERLTGVSKSTISRYLNGQHVKKANRDKIQEAIEKSGYRHNIFARLNAHKSNIIGIVVPSFNSVTTPRIVEQIIKRLGSLNLSPLIMHSNNNAAEEINCLHQLHGMNVDGIICISTGETPEHRKFIKFFKKPLLFVGQEIHGGHSICNDDYHAGYELGKYIGSKKYTRPLLLWVKEYDHAVGISRKQGVIDGLAQAGIANYQLCYTTFIYEEVLATLQENLKLDDLPDVIICATDRIAESVYKLCQQHNLSIGVELAVTGFGDYITSELIQPSLTTINFDWQYNADLIINSLERLFTQEPIPELQTIRFKLMMRNSTPSNMRRLRNFVQNRKEIASKIQSLMHHSKAT